MTVNLLLISLVFLSVGFKKTSERFGLYCYTGKQGTGKTYSAIKFVIDEKFRNDYVVITNVKSFRMFEDTVFIDDISKLMEFVVSHYQDMKMIILFDEIFSYIEKNHSLSKNILSFISQLRKRGIIFVTTAQEWAEINITLRRYVRYQVSCNMFALPLSRTAILLNQMGDGDNIHWDNDLQEFIAPIIKTKLSKGNVSVANSYDTYETINAH